MKAFNQEHIHIAAQRYGVHADEIVKVGGFENLVYKFDRDAVTSILRISHNSHRDAQQFQAELDWISYLADHGIRVSRPLPSVGGKLLEVIPSEGGGEFMLTAFESAPGAHVNGEHPSWGPELFSEWGYITGLMHAYTKTYKPPAGLPRRITPGILGDGQEFSELSAEQQSIYRRITDCEKQIQALPRNDENYGLCHRDLHHGNFYVHDGKITAFDFDDCGYDYFVQDIAMAVYYATIFPVWHSPVRSAEQATEFANRFFTTFMEGYERANSLDHAWLKHLPLFIEKRRSELCLILLDVWGPEHPHQERRAWLEYNVDGLKRDIPCMQIDI